MAIKHLSPRSKKEIEKIFNEKHFKKYWTKRIEDIKKCAIRDSISFEDYITISLPYTSLLDYKLTLLKRYEQQECHSFWRRECENRSIECYRCRYYYSVAERDKMTKEEIKQRR